MTEYCNSMSLDAVKTHRPKEMQKSKWTKEKIINVLDQAGIDTAEIKKYKSEILKNVLLTKTAYYHRGKYSRVTEFFSVIPDTKENILEKLKNYLPPKPHQIWVMNSKLYKFLDLQKRKNVITQEEFDEIVSDGISKYEVINSTFCTKEILYELSSGSVTLWIPRECLSV